MHSALEQIKPETVELLATAVQASGLSVDEYMRSLLGEPVEPKEEVSPQEKARRWEEFVEKHSVSVNHFVDDSRESVYTREDEAL